MLLSVLTKLLIQQRCILKRVGARVRLAMVLEDIFP